MEKLLSLPDETWAIHQLQHTAVQYCTSPLTPPRVSLNSQLISRADPAHMVHKKSSEIVDVRSLWESNSEIELGFRGLTIGSSRLLQPHMNTTQLHLFVPQKSSTQKVKKLWTDTSSSSKKT